MCGWWEEAQVQCPQTSPRLRTAVSTCVKITATSSRVCCWGQGWDGSSGVGITGRTGRSLNTDHRVWCLSVWAQWQRDLVCAGVCLQMCAWAADEFVPAKWAEKCGYVLEFLCKILSWAENTRCWSSYRCHLKHFVVVFMLPWLESSDPARFIPEGFTDGLKPLKQLSASGDRRWY